MSLANARVEGVRRPLRLLYLISTFSMGGAERHLYDLVSRLPRDQYQVAVAFLREQAEEARSLVADFRQLDVEVVDLKMTPRWNVWGLWRLGRLLRRYHPDIVHAHLYEAELFGVGMARLFRVPGVVCTLHSMELYRVRRPLRRLLATAYRFADRVITVFDGENVRLRHEYGLPAQRVVTIYNGFEAFGEEDSRVSAAGAPRATGPVIGTMARLSRQKAHPVLLEAFACVHQSEPQARLIVAGGDAGGMRPALEALATRLGVRDGVEYRGYVDDVKSFLQGLDLFVLASDWEGLPLAVLEAMACGLPVVATRVGGVPEVVVDGVTGLLVPPGDPESLGRAVVQLLQDPRMAREMGERGRQRVRQEFGMDTMMERTRAVYGEIARAKGLVR